MLSSYSVSNLVRTTEFLLDLSRDLGKNIAMLQNTRSEVAEKQQEAQNQGLIVRKMTDYLSAELGRIESSLKEVNSEALDKNLEKLSQTEARLKLLRERLNDFVESDDAERLKRSDSALAEDLQRYESFLTSLANHLNEKIPQVEKILGHIKAESREADQQKLLLKEMVELFNSELEDLDSAFSEVRGAKTVS